MLHLRPYPRSTATWCSRVHLKRFCAEKRNRASINANQIFLGFISVVLILSSYVQPKWIQTSADLDIRQWQAGLTTVEFDLKNTNCSMPIAKFCTLEEQRVFRLEEWRVQANMSALEVRAGEIFLSFVCGTNLVQTTTVFVMISLIMGFIGLSLSLALNLSDHLVFAKPRYVLTILPALCFVLQASIGTSVIVTWNKVLESSHEAEILETCRSFDLYIASFILAFLVGLSMGVSVHFPNLCEPREESRKHHLHVGNVDALRSITISDHHREQKFVSTHRNVAMGTLSTVTSHPTGAFFSNHLRMIDDEFSEDDVDEDDLFYEECRQSSTSTAQHRRQENRFSSSAKNNSVPTTSAA